MTLAKNILDPAAVLALQQLATEYWMYADGDKTIAIGDLFTEDAKLVLGSLTMSGREEIATFFAERDALHRATGRATRHVGCNYWFSALDRTRVRVRSTVVVYAGAGTLPLEATAPSAIADFDDVCVIAQERWRFAQRIARTAFLGPGAATFAR